MQNTISLLREQIVAEQNEQKLLQIEHHTLKFQMAACEKQRIVLEGKLSHPFYSLTLMLIFMFV